MSTSALIGYDCGRKAGNITTISLREVAPCEIQNPNPEMKNIELQLLQRLEFEEVYVITCRVKVDRHIRRYSRLLSNSQYDVKKGEESFFIPISRDTCHDMHKFGSFEYEKSIIRDLKVNSTARRTQTLAGKVEEDGGCTGTEFKTEQFEYYKVFVTSKLEIEIYDYMASANRDKDELILRSGSRCSYKDTRCTDADGRHVFWDYVPTSVCNYKQYVLLYDGKGVKVGNNTVENPDVYFANTTEQMQFGLMKNGELNICGYRIFSTDHPKLFITEYPRGKGVPAEKSLNVNDILLSAYFNTKIAYLARHLKSQFTTMYNDMLLQRCRLQRQVIQNSLMHMYTKPDIAALTIMQNVGYTAVPVGEVAHIVACEQTFCKVRLVEECFQEIPVTCRNESYFLKPFSRIMTKTGTPRTCNNILPAVYLIEDSWLKFSPKPDEARIPQVLKPMTSPTWRYQDINGLIEGGIYTLEDLNRLHAHSTFPAERFAYIEEVARRLSDEGHHSSSMDFGNLIDKHSLQRLVENSIKKVWNGFTEFGIFFAGIMGIMTLVTILKLVVDTVIHGYTLHFIYGWSVHLLGAILGSITHLLVTLANKDRNAMNPTPSDTTETSNGDLQTPRAVMPLAALPPMPIRPTPSNEITPKPSAPLAPIPQVLITNFSKPENLDQIIPYIPENSPRSNELERRLFAYFNKINDCNE